MRLSWITMDKSERSGLGRGLPQRDLTRVSLLSEVTGDKRGPITVFGIWRSDGNQLPPAGETACPTYVAKRLIQQGGAGGFACRSHGHNQWSPSKMNKSRKRVKRPRFTAFPVCTISL